MTHPPLGVAILPGLAALGHADFGIGSSEHPDVGRGRVLDTLIRVVDFRPVLSQSAIQGDQCQRLVCSASVGIGETPPMN